MGRKAGRKFSDSITLRLDPDMKKVLEEKAAEEERSIGQLVRLILRGYFSGQPSKPAIPPSPARKRKSS
jgi:predicted HicB family RNase H-like nuclease